MRIAIVVEVFLPKRDGVTATVERVLKYLQQQKHEVLILAPGESVSTCCGYGVVPAAGFPLRFYPGLRYNIFSPAMAKKLTEFQPDLIQMFDPIMLGLQMFYFCKMFMPKVPLVYTYCTNIVMYTSIFGYPQLAPLFWGMLKIMHRTSKVTLVPSLSIKDDLVNRGFRGEIIRWPRPVDFQRFHPSKKREELRAMWTAGELGKPAQGGNDKIILLFVSRISWEKGLNTLRDAYENLDHSRFHLVIVGDGPARSEFEPYFLPGEVSFVGWRSGEELAEAFASADIFLFASLTETFGNVLLEAAASGLPIVACDALGARDLVLHGKTGFLSPPGDAEAFSNSILTIANNPTLRQSMGVGARQFAERFTWDFSFNIVGKAYETVSLLTSLEFDSVGSRLITRIGNGKST
ncbi:glycosyltransferase family 4 protein [Aulographum hederae CBS 113979]|uniref:Glycosyltransferase family 4 protein n=1 Tax=Aulographum hederae CBS 113979 TaxID=1176131 RepID=A0A6G1GX79_9PEZI|nr:glycosyltransferase family 4 protein [Aulographum hederae CBS 113979]